MGISWNQEESGLLSIRTSGKLGLYDMLGVELEIEPLIASQHDLHALIILENFQGWEENKDWGNPNFLPGENWNHFSKLAVVGDEKWHDNVMLFLLASVVPTKIRYFPTGKEMEARIWLQDNEQQRLH